jgi:hypothetical protein
VEKGISPRTGRYEGTVHIERSGGLGWADPDQRGSQVSVQRLRWVSDEVQDIQAFVRDSDLSANHVHRDACGQASEKSEVGED